MVIDIKQVNQILSLPIGVVKLLRDAFICKICHVAPMKPHSLPQNALGAY